VSYRYRILHIADPHFTNSHFLTGNPSDIGDRHARELIGQLEKHELLSTSFDAMVLSGDFTFRFAAEGFVAAEEFIQQLSYLVRPKGIVVIPGNHDIDLKQPIPIKELRLPTPKPEAEEKFRAFLARIEPHIGTPNQHLSMVTRIDGKPGLVIVGLNSCRVERMDAQGWGYVGMDQIDNIGRKLLSADGAKDGDIVLAVTHHNLLPIWDLGLQVLGYAPDKRKFSFTMDAGSVLSFLADLGIGALLHGHTHVQSVKRVEGYGSNDGKNGPMLVLGAGSLGIAGLRDDPPHHCQIIEIEDGLVKFLDLSCLVYPRNTPRIWDATPPVLGGSIFAFWEGKKAKSALTAHLAKSKTASFDYQNMQSWSELRARELGPHAWNEVIDRLYEMVHKMEPAATRDKVLQTVEDLLSNPPPEHEICNWAVESYIARKLK
jgi:predicted phosphodiesterase